MRRRLIGGLALALLALPVLAAIGALAMAAGQVDLLGAIRSPYIRHVIGFALLQAALSALISVALALPVTRALARRPDFPGHGLLLRLFGLPLVLPAIIASLAIVAVYGQSGWLAAIWQSLGLGVFPSIYGLGGILMVHVFFNLPLAVRLMLPSWQAIPAEHWRLAAGLDMSSWTIFRLIEWPRLKARLAGATALIFLLCFVSFAPVLALGGGPAAANLEVAIYQALRFDFDLDRAVALALLQSALGAAVVLLALGSLRSVPAVEGLRPLGARPDARGGWQLMLDRLAIGLAALWVGLPLAAVLGQGLFGPWAEGLAAPSLWRAFATSLALAGGAAALGLALSLGLALGFRHRRAMGGVETVGLLGLLVSPLALGTGFFVLFRQQADSPSFAFLLIVFVNMLMAMPYFLRLLLPAAAEAATRHDRLCSALGLSGWARFRWIDWPVLRRPAAVGCGFAAALAAGDLGAVSFFARGDNLSLAMLLYRQLGAYRVDHAAVTAILLAGLCLALYLGAERWIGGRHA